MLAFRNRLVQTPYVCSELTTKDELVHVDQRLSAVRWPMDSKAVEVAQGESSVRYLHSIEGAAVLSVSPDEETFWVETLTPVTMPRAENQYTSIRQMFFIEDAPAQYRRPLAITQGKLRHGKDDGVLLSYVSEDLPRTPGEAHEAHWSHLSEVHGLILDLCAAPTKAVPLSDRICFEWSPTATFRWSQQKSQTQVSVAADGSMLSVGRNGYFHHVFDSATERWYAPDGVPRVVRCREGIDPYELQAITDHAARINEQHFQEINSAAARPIKELKYRISNSPSTSRGELEERKEEEGTDGGALRVLEVQDVAGIGRFTYLSNDSVKVVFHDRTVLSSDVGFQQCEIISAEDASSMIVNAATPCAAARYVRKAEQFLHWARTAREPGAPPQFTDPDPLMRAHLDAALHALRAQRLHVKLHLERLSLLTSRGPSISSSSS
ncbi:Hypothetical Protein FCC1311_055782 [Hondaea fermentalgiana]|uniref:C5orf34-like C-terminal domain-containing protein n=1 Tax=Hondaea fermentalgiana TaxID=2315210 RepID=A0A2R5GEK4_9STRA|nr:Hypothetical Protein FCC1311_055782 [Hondaea fermentalgiana]|eukprot:GBG29356.1 Hypothetical Protein FCC1311_055782 [Hondaea fermentalgiana]